MFPGEVNITLYCALDSAHYRLVNYHGCKRNLIGLALEGCHWPSEGGYTEKWDVSLFFKRPL